MEYTCKQAGCLDYCMCPKDTLEKGDRGFIASTGSTGCSPVTKVYSEISKPIKETKN